MIKNAYDEEYVRKITLELKGKSEKCSSLRDSLELAYSFKFDEFSIKPSQIKREIESLLEILSQDKPKTVLEIGTSNGGTLFLLCKVSSMDATLLSIDLPDGKFGGELYPDWKVPFYESFRENNQKLHLIRSDSHAENTLVLVKKFLGKKKLDFLLIDADHTYEGVKRDFEMYSPLVKTGGIIAFHDINPGPNEYVGDVPSFWKEICSKYTSIEILENEGTESYGFGLLFYDLKNQTSSKYVNSLKLVNKLKDRQIIELHKRTKSLEYNIKENPMGDLLFAFMERPDLQQAFPESKKGDHKKLIQWAYEVSSGKIIDPYKDRLNPYLDWYKQESSKLEKIDDIKGIINQYENTISELDRQKTELSNSIEKITSELAKRTESYEILNKLSESLSETIRNNETTLADLTKTINDRDTSLADLSRTIKEKESINLKLEDTLKNYNQQIDTITTISKEKDDKIRNLEIHNDQVLNELSQTKSILSEIQQSFGYNLLLSIQHQLDNSFPDGSRRGELKKILIASLHMIKKDGKKKYLSAVGEKISRRELRVLSNPRFKKQNQIVVTSSSITKPRPVSKPNIENNSGLQFGINFSGYFTGEFGIGESARSIVRGLKYSGIPFVLNNIEVAGQRSNDNTFSVFSDEYPYKINIVHVNAIDTPGFVTSHGLGFFNNRYNIAVWFWELSNFPEVWAEQAKFFDEIWVYTNFVAKSLAISVRKPVVKITPTIYIETKKLVQDKKRFGLKEEDFVFLYIFDFQSILERKNPYAAISAFKKAFKKQTNAVLVLKYMNAEYYPDEENRLLKECEGINVKIIDSQMDKTELLSLMLSCDCYVSLHRTEGFGYTMADAMYLGKPVIATPYGGNTDFMNIRNSFLVKYKLIELNRDFGVYKKGNVWADPDVDDTAFLMRYVYENQDLADEIGKRSSEYIKKFFNSKVTANEILARLEPLS